MSAWSPQQTGEGWVGVWRFTAESQKRGVRPGYPMTCQNFSGEIFKKYHTLVKVRQPALHTSINFSCITSSLF